MGICWESQEGYKDINPNDRHDSNNSTDERGKERNTKKKLIGLSNYGTGVKFTSFVEFMGDLDLYSFVSNSFA